MIKPVTKSIGGPAIRPAIKPSIRPAVSPLKCPVVKEEKKPTPTKQG